MHYITVKKDKLSVVDEIGFTNGRISERVSAGNKLYFLGLENVLDNSLNSVFTLYQLFSHLDNLLLAIPSWYYFKNDNKNLGLDFPYGKVIRGILYSPYKNIYFNTVNESRIGHLKLPNKFLNENFEYDLFSNNLYLEFV